jgi:hypothetical protein
LFRQYRKFEPNELIAIGVDTAMGGEDNCAAQFFSRTKMDVPLVYQQRIVATEMTNLIFPIFERIFNQTNVRPIVAYERNNGGLFEMERLAVMNRSNKFEVFRMPSAGRINPPDAVKYGWETNTATRPKMIQELKEAIDKKVIRIYDKETIDELYSFVIMQTSSSWKAQAEKGAHDDLVMALAIALQIHLNMPYTPNSQSIMPNFPDEKLFNKDGFY